MNDLATSYVGQPDIPVGVTIAEYRRTRHTARSSWWRRAFWGRR